MALVAGCCECVSPAVTVFAAALLLVVAGGWWALASLAVRELMRVCPAVLSQGRHVTYQY